MNKTTQRLLPFAITAMLILSACTPATPSPTATVLPAATLPPTSTPWSTSTITPTPPQPTVTPAAGQVCSPLQGIQLNEFADILTTPLQTPQPGQDDGHQGVDFAFYSHGDIKTMLGLPIQAALAGRVAAVVTNRNPYGNSIMLETALSDLPPAWVQALNLPQPVASIQPDPRMICPAQVANSAWNSPSRSIYIVYAHLKDAPTLHLGDSVSCGAAIGGVGTTGMSVNPHLHFETRVGPSNQKFDGMAYYYTGATSTEMANYCLWRVSGVFQIFDPLSLLALPQK